MKPIDILTGGAHSENIKKGICTTCNKLVGDFRDFKDALSAKEYKISGMCQECQDSVFGKD